MEEARPTESTSELTSSQSSVYGGEKLDDFLFHLSLKNILKGHNFLFYQNDLQRCIDISTDEKKNNRRNLNF